MREIGAIDQVLRYAGMLGTSAGGAGMSEARGNGLLAGAGSSNGANALGGSPMSLPNDQGMPDRDGYPVPGLGNIKKGQTPYHTEHNYNKAMYNKLVNARNMLDRIREEMDRLSEMGDTVAPEDVIAAAGRVAGHGVPARELAQILSTMPTMAGQGLAAWVAQQDMAVTQQERHVDQVSDIAAHRMALSALRTIAVEHLAEEQRRMSPEAPGRPSQHQAIRQNPLGPVGPAAPLPGTQVIQMAQRPERQGPAAEEAV
jgi:hypothetical protein